MRRRTPHSAQPHLLLVSYLFLPSARSGARRTTALRNALERLGVRTTVLTSTISGRSAQDDGEGIARAADLRSLRAVRSMTELSRRRWWSRVVVPDATALSWAPCAAFAAERIVRRDRPDAVFTSSPPESVHLLGLALHARGVPWIADFRDGWAFEPPTLRPYATRLDRALERLVVTRADAVTTVTAHLANDLRARYGRSRRIVELSNGFEPADAGLTPDGSPFLDPTRFSLVYTGTLTLNGKDAHPFLEALSRLIAEKPALADGIEVVFAGPLAPSEEHAMRAVRPAGVVKVLGELPHQQALGLQRAADGLLLITPPRAVRDAATAKVYEYLAAGKPILALAAGSSAAQLLEVDHTIAPPNDRERILQALREYLDRWALRRERFSPSTGIDQYALPQIAHRLVELLAEIGAVDPLRT